MLLIGSRRSEIHSEIESQASVIESLEYLLNADNREASFRGSPIPPETAEKARLCLERAKAALGSYRPKASTSQLMKTYHQTAIGIHQTLEALL